LDVSEIPAASRNLGNRTMLGVRLNANGKRDLQSFIEETSFVPFRSQVFGASTNQDEKEGVASKRRKLDSVP